MGYDMTWVKKPEPDSGLDSYFRLNIWGMGRFREAMARIGMVFEDNPWPTFPEPDDFGIELKKLWAYQMPEEYPDVQLTDAERKLAAEFFDQENRTLTTHNSETPGIPLHKLSDNSGWCVLPAECEAAVRIHEAWVATHGVAALTELVGDDIDYWHQWIQWMRDAARHGGFEVF